MNRKAPETAQIAQAPDQSKQLGMKRKLSQNRGLPLRRGISLVELVLSFSLLAMVFLVVLNLVPMVVFGELEARHRLLALNRAGELLDTCSAGPFSHLQPGTYDAAAPGPMIGYLNDFTEDSITYRSILDVENVPGILPKHAKRVKVRVVWEERRKSLQVARVRTISAIRR